MLRRSEADQIRAAAVAGDIAELDRILASLVPAPVKKFPRDHVLAVVLGRNVYQCQGDECEMVQTSPGYCAACRPMESEIKRAEKQAKEALEMRDKAISMHEEAWKTIAGLRAERDALVKNLTPVLAYFGEQWVGDKPAPCITGGRLPASGGVSVGDPRVDWANAGHYGILPWNRPAPCVTGAASVDNGKSSIADPREAVRIGEAILISPDATWHRPLTTLEMAALQGFPWQDAAGLPLVLDGRSRAKWQERTGNAIPPPAARAIGNEMVRELYTLESRAFRSDN